MLSSKIKLLGFKPFVKMERCPENSFDTIFHLHFKVSSLLHNTRRLGFNNCFCDHKNIIFVVIFTKMWFEKVELIRLEKPQTVLQQVLTNEDLSSHTVDRSYQAYALYSQFFRAPFRQNFSSGT